MASQTRVRKDRPLGDTIPIALHNETSSLVDLREERTRVDAEALKLAADLHLFVCGHYRADQTEVGVDFSVF